ncbi:MAG: PP2C family serine/threonine-protein phosphatase, partial [Planctomycetota bacterium]
VLEVVMRDRGEVLPLGDAALGWAFACSRAGSAHVRSGKPCQDAYALWSGAVAGQSCMIAAVADGHGDDRHDQSQYGAALAVRAAIEEMVGLQTHFGGVGLSSQLVNSFKTDFPRRLGRRWRKAVIANARRRLRSEGSGENQEKSDLLPRYGTTLLAALVVGNTLLVGQIGDGETMLVRPDGIVDFPLACESEDVGVVTDSLCSAEAHRRWRTAALDSSKGGLVLLSTDGLVNAFSDEIELNVFARSMKDRIREFGLLQVASSLPGWLDHYSGGGSGDDITLAVVMIQPGSEGQV